MGKWVLALGCILFCFISLHKTLFAFPSLFPSSSYLHVRSLGKVIKKRINTVEDTQIDIMASEPNYAMNHNISRINTFKVRERSIHFFPWNDGFDYEQICTNLIQVLSSFKKSSIVNSGRYGGLGHKFLTVYNTVTAALVLGRPYYLHLEDVYWKSMNSCFEFVKFTGDHRQLFSCNAKAKCFTSKSFSSIPNKNVWIPDARFTNDILCSDKTMRIINSYHIFGRDVSCTEYKRIILRLLTNPTYNTTTLILKKQSELISPNQVIGVHIRSGGKTADSKERKVIMDPSTFHTLPQRIKKVVETFGDEYMIYLSTDSARLDKMIVNAFPKGKVVTTSVFTRGHTTFPSVSDDTIQRALVDMYMVAYAKTIVYTQKSGFSSLCMAISNAEAFFMIPSLL